jgi:hypothetical protein
VSYPATDSGPYLDAEARRSNALSLLFFLLIAAALLIRFSISPQMMNAVVDYNSDTGPLWQRIHFGTYAIVLLLPVLLVARPILLVGDEIGKFRALVRFTGLMVLMVVLLVVLGRSGNTGIYIDTYIVAGCAGLLLFTVNDELRRALGNVALGFLLLSALMGIFEAVTETRILPYDLTEDTFRPIGLTDHPLTLGMMCASGIGFVTLARWPIWARVLGALVLFIGAAASGARFSLLCAGFAILALLLLTPWRSLSRRHERQAKLAVLLLTLAGGAALIAVLAAGGLLSRFSDGLLDENYMARITIYQIFGLVDWKQIIFGTDVGDILAIVNAELGLPYIESTPVVLVFQLGLPFAIAFAWLVFWIFGRLLKFAPPQAWVGIVTFFVTALSNNLLSSKTPVVTLFIVLLVAFARRTPRIEGRVAPGPRPSTSSG